MAPGATHQASVQMAWAEFSARQGEVDQALEQAAAAVALASRSGAMANVRRIVLDADMPCLMSCCCIPCPLKQLPKASWLSAACL